MKKIILPITILMIGSATVAAAQGYRTAEKKDVPEGMEVIQVSDGYQMVVPKGAKVEQVGSQLKVEDSAGYLLRKVQAMEEQLKKIEESLAKLQEQFNEQLERSQKETFANLVDLKNALRELQSTQTTLQEEFAQLKELLAEKK